ncbi:Cys-tRNA(Pro)/Cys-tRNA(Cys) deacylase [Psychromonas marina]|uniref:Cys-tRNA(Pro)/Cys-tRNA(Cys) deacylase n=1 Tax=Psychromonas marina TaxID=88364 RepID=A0ABQ6DZ27_9GAMM|nr:Cys-tRNA(Pro) deacylase [Psychromonas marina]GLS90016.1 Cys-tRNA(Pro)/Cys-tRNA(Cys) deacylase [Psychromonas marina]
MTPATKLLKKQKIAFTVHEYSHDKNSESYGLEAAEKLGVEHHLVFKTLVVALDNSELVVAILPVAEKLSMKLVAKTFSAKKAQMANTEDVLRSTGYVLGGVSPLGQKKRLKTVINNSAFEAETIFVSAGKRGLEVELAPLELQKLLQAKNNYICQ